jgi:anaphase-promoting complex subunit 5
MSRHLTPAKIGLLALIELYVEEAVPNDAILPVINFISSQLLNCSLPGSSSADTKGGWTKVESSIGVILSIRDFERVLGPLAAVDRLPGRRLWDRFLEKLWGIDSLHALQEFFDHLPDYLARTKEELRRLGERGDEPHPGIQLSRTSPFGAFLRRCHLEFLRLQFSNAADLWKAFVKYRQPTADHWRRRNPHYGRLSFDSVLMTGEHEWGDNTDELAVVAYGNMLLGTDQDDTTPVSTEDVECLIEGQVDLIHREFSP